MAGMRRSPNSTQVEKWLGVEQANHLSLAMKDWYADPIPIAVGGLFVCAGGDFIGAIQGGAFTSLSDMIAEATTGKSRTYFWQKVGATGVIGVTNSLWGLGPQPAAGANAANAPGGEAPTDATTGAVLIDNVSTDTRHTVSGWAACEDAGNSLLLYDRIFQVNKTMNSTATEAVTGVPTRYQSTVATAADYIGGNFGFIEVGGTVLAATAHNWTVCTYTDQAAAASTLPSVVGNVSAIVRRLDQPIQQWFVPLETGNVGIKAWTQMQASALVATGVINFVIGHPLAWLPIPIANLICLQDFVGVTFNLARIFDDAAMALLEVTKPSTSATTYNVSITAVHG